MDGLLLSLARQQQCITYAELATNAQIPSPHRIHKLTQHLEARTAEHARTQAPILAALVISKRGTGLPADGFFACCASHGIQANTGESMHAFHARLLSQVFRAFENDKPHTTPVR